MAAVGAPAPTATSVSIGWTAPSTAGNGKPISGYNVKYSLTSGGSATDGSYISVAANTSTNPAIHDTTSIAEGWIYYVVYAVNAVGTSVKSNEL